jgi:Protein of unknown function DUF2625
VRTLSELVETDDPAWPEIEAAVAAAPYSVLVLEADPRQADDELVKLQVTTRSWLGAVVHRTGGLVLDGGWLRVMGSGNGERHLASLSAINQSIAGGIVVAQDVLGGQFAWVAVAGGEPTISYFSPDTLRWGDWIGACFGHAGADRMTGWLVVAGQTGVGIQGLPAAAWMRASRVSMPCRAAVAM